MQWVCESPQLPVHLTKSKKRTKRNIGDKDQDSFYCAAASNTKWQAQIGMCLRLFPSRKMKACALSIFSATLLITTYNVLKVCHCQNPPDHPLHISAH